jgi:hypothetical protein
MKAEQKILIAIFLVITLCSLIPTSLNAQENLSINTAVITGKYEIPNCPEYLNNAVFYQIYP